MTEWKAMNGCGSSEAEDDFRFDERLKDGGIDYGGWYDDDDNEEEEDERNT